MVAAADNPNANELSTFLVRCWSDPENDVLVKIKSYSLYQAADDARFEMPGYENYDPVCVLQEALDPARLTTMPTLSRFKVHGE